MNKTTAFVGIIVIALAGFIYWHMTIRDYDLVHTGMTAEEVALKIGKPDLMATEMGMDMWFYGIKNKEERRGSFGSTQYSFNADFAVIFDPASHQVMTTGKSPDKAWMVSLSSATTP